MNKQKGLAPILIVLIVALVVGGYLIYQKQIKPVPQQNQPTPSPIADETATLKQYTDPEWGFSLRYPKDWYLLTKGQAGIGSSIAISSFNLEGVQSKGDWKSKLRINIYREKTDKAKSEEYLKSTSENIVSTKKIFLDGIEAVRSETKGLGTGLEVVSVKSGYAYVITASPSNSDLVEVFDQILSTFRFD